MNFRHKNTILSFSVLALSILLAPGMAFAQSGNNASGCGEGTLGGVICNLMNNAWNLPGLVTGAAYLMALIFAFMGVMKLKSHVEQPTQTEIWDPIKRFIAGGCFAALPTVASAVRRTLEGNGANYANTGWNGAVSGGGLDSMIVKLMTDVFVPLQWVFGWFGYVAGLILVFIGIMRLMNTEREGPRGPTGIGTLMTFIVAGCLFSINSMIAYFTGTLFDDSVIKTDGALQYTSGLGGAAPHIHAVISSIIAFAIVIGWVSLIRGFFILRGVSEGNSQASMMAAITHLIGGALAVNLGSIIMAVQNTLGITKYGIIFQ